MKHIKPFEAFLNESNKYQIEIIYDKPFDTTTIQGPSPDGFKGITVKGNYEKEWKGKYTDIDAAIRNIEKGLHRYDIIQVQK
jgi:hypothetical protein